MPEISLEHYSDLFGLSKSHDLTRLMTSISELSNAATGFDWGNYWCARPNYFEHISGVYLGWRGSELVAICAYQRWPFDGSVILYGDTVFVHPELQRSGIALRMWVRLLARQLVIARGRTAYVAGRTDTPEMLEALNRYGQHMVWAPRADSPRNNPAQLARVAEYVASRISPDKTFDKDYFVVRGAYEGLSPFVGAHLRKLSPPVRRFYEEALTPNGGDGVIFVLRWGFADAPRLAPAIRRILFPGRRTATTGKPASLSSAKRAAR